jgi:hypothetical protein
MPPRLLEMCREWVQEKYPDPKHCSARYPEWEENNWGRFFPALHDESAVNNKNAAECWAGLTLA